MTRRNLGPALLVVVAGALFAAGATHARRAGAQTPPVPSPAPAATGAAQDPGRVLFVQACSSCHGQVATGTANGPTLVGVGAADVDWYLSTGRMPLATPAIQSPRKPTEFTADQRAAIVAYVTSLGPGGPSIPVVDTVGVSVARGGDLFRANCAACHGATGIGGALAYGAYAPSLHQATPLQVAEAMGIGPANMPVFDDRLSPVQIDEIVAYVKYLHHPQDRGGAGLGHVGPIAEGFVGLLFGVAGLMLVAYWVGDRTRAEA
ncbi:MAG: c-type cytochrome [Actinomycetota bacterium]|nr:c-type cytochrome [Actinomycetota bacterium]